MSSKFILYLAVEGVLVPRTARPTSDCGDAFCIESRPHLLRLASILSEEEQVRIVINSAWVLAGFRRVLDVLPVPLRMRVVGATVPGNRLLRHHRTADRLSKSAWLMSDVKRREPEHLAVLESDARNVPASLRDRAVIVPGGLWAARGGDWARLRRMLASTD